MKDYKEISIENKYDKNMQIFNTIKIEEKFYLITTDEHGNGLYKYLFIKTEEHNKISFLHKKVKISCYRIPCIVCRQSKCLGGKPIKIR